MRDYFCSVYDYYATTPLEKMDPDALRQIKRCMVDFLGVSLRAAVQERQSESAALGFISSLQSGGEEAEVWGMGRRLSAPAAAFANSYLGALLELDDATSLGASVHPAAVVIPAVLAAAECNAATGEAVLRAALLGYDICNRVGLMSTDMVRQLGLYGPGLAGGPAAAMAAGMLYGLDREQLFHAFSIAASLSPVCPFVNFIDGAEVKNLYTGWAVYTAMLAVQMAKRGLTGSPRVLEGPKSLAAIYTGRKGVDTPPEEHSFAQDVVFKDFSACLSVYAALTALLQLRQENAFALEDISGLLIRTYPYAVELSEAADPQNPISARLHLPYTAAAALFTGRLGPEAFSPESLQNPAVLQLMQKIQVQVHPGYAAGAFGARGSEVTVTLQDGSTLRQETAHARWSAQTPPSDEDLAEKFKRMTKEILPEKDARRLWELLFALEAQPGVQEIIHCLTGEISQQ